MKFKESLESQKELEFAQVLTEEKYLNRNPLYAVTDRNANMLCEFKTFDDAYQYTIDHPDAYAIMGIKDRLWKYRKGEHITTEDDGWRG